MNIGIFKRVIEVDPVELPFKKKQEETPQEPAREEPKREPVKVGAR